MHSSQPLPAAALAAVLVSALPAQQRELSKEMAEVGAAYAAKVTASAVFVSGRTVESVMAQELAPDRPIQALIGPLLKIDVDQKERAVTCRLGPAVVTAVATRNLGCTLCQVGVTAAALSQRGAPGVADLRPDAANIDWPLGDRMPPAPSDDPIDEHALAAAIDAAFAEAKERPLVHTRAVVVVHRGRLVAERYADGFTAQMPLPGWSMTKTITNALVGIRVRQGKLDLDAPLSVPEWNAEGDPRAAIRLSHLLTMSSGLQWNEDYEDPTSDALRMLLRSFDHAAEFARQPRRTEPGTHFEYASGSTNLVCRVLRSTFDSDAAYWAFPQQELFGPLGMRSAMLETDPSGTFVGSSYGFATARDWARFGMLYAQDGEFGGVRVLPAGWVARSAVPHPGSGGRCGMHLWLNADPDGDGPLPRPWPDLPADLLRMDGHEGQYVTVFPKDQLVVVRLGCTKNGGFDLRGMLRAVRSACVH